MPNSGKVRPGSAPFAGHSAGGCGRAVPVILFLAFLFYLNFLSRVLFSPILPLVQGEYDLSNIQAGSLFFFISSGYCLSVCFSGFVSAKINHANTILLSSCCAGGMLIAVSFSHTFFLFCTGLFCLGLAAGLHLPSALSTIFRIMPSAYLARGMAMHELAPNLGFITAPLLWQLAGGYFSWRQCLLGMGCVIIVVGAGYGLSPLAVRSSGVRPDGILLRTLFCRARFWLLVLVFSLAISSTLGIYAMLPLFLVNGHSMEMDHANLIVSLSRLVSLFTPFAGGWLGDRVGNSRVMAAVLLTGGLLTAVMGMSSGTFLIAIIVIQAMVAVCFFPSGLAVLSSYSVLGRDNVAISFCIPIGFVIGGGLVPLGIGRIGDGATIGTGVALAGLVIFAGGLAALVFLKDEQ